MKTPLRRSPVGRRLTAELLEDRVNPIVAYGLLGGATPQLVAFDTANPGAALPPVAIAGVTPGDVLVGIDVRPQNGVLYAVGVNEGLDTGTVYVIAPRTGQAAAVGSFSGAGDLPNPSVARYGVDFNPVPDRLRITTSTGLNFRLNPNTGGLAGSDDPINPAPISVDEVAYTNPSQNAAFTTLYTLSSAQDALYIQSNVLGAGGNPNSGTQINALPLGTDVLAVHGFDIDPTVTVGESNTAVASGIGYALITNAAGTGLATVDLTTGAITGIVPIGNNLTGFVGFALNPQQPGGTATAFGTAAIALGSDGVSLVRFNTADPAGTASAPVPVTGLGANILVGLDYRPQTWQLFGLGLDETVVPNTVQLYRIDPQTGAATAVGAAVEVDLASNFYGFDFNPTVDRIRVINAVGQNFVLDPNGVVAAVFQTPISPIGAVVTATAYTNNFAQDITAGNPTTQYTLDAANNRLAIQNPPAGGVQSNFIPITLNGAPLDFTTINGFDIPPWVRTGAAGSPAQPGAGLGYAVLEVGSASGLYSIDLATGAATLLGAVPAASEGFTLGDAPSGAIQFAAPTFPGAEGQTVPVTLTRTGGTAGMVTVNLLVTQGGTTTTIPVTFADGQTAAVANVPVPQNGAVGPNADVALALASPTNGAVIGGPDAAAITVTNDDVLSVGGAAGSGQGGSLAVLFNPDGTVARSIAPFGAAFTGGVRVATGDFNGDDVTDLVVGNGPGIASVVQVIDGATGNVLFQVNPFEASFTGGVFVAAGDVTGDGVADLVVTPDQGGGPRVQVYDGDGFAKIADFFGIDDANFFGGARAGVADINNDGFGDLIVSAGFLGGPRVAVFSGATVIAGQTPQKLFNDIFVFESTLRNGSFVTGADVNGDGFADLIAGAGPGGGPRVVAFDGRLLLQGQQVLVSSFFAGDSLNRNGVPVAVTDFDGDGAADLLTGTGEPQSLPGAPPAPPPGVGTFTVYSATGITAATPTPLDTLTPFAGFVGGVFVG